MKAVVFDRYGPPDVLRIEEVERPVPEDDEVLVNVHATTVTRSDTGFRGAEYFIARIFTGVFRPRRRVLGIELAGEVVAVGAATSGFQVGDRVFGIGGSAHAEYVCVRADGALAHLPAGLSFEEAAAVCDGACLALACLGPAEALKGKDVLVYGASGSTGTAGVQLAKHFGAKVTAVCNTRNLDLVRSLGADEVIDYTEEDYRRRDATYDVFFDAVGKHSFRRCRRSLKPGGTYVSTDPGFMWHVPLLALATTLVGERRVRMGIVKHTKENVLFVKQLVEAGEYRAVIDRRYRLEDVVDATRYVETGQKPGNVVLTLDGIGPDTREDVEA